MYMFEFYFCSSLLDFFEKYDFKVFVSYASLKHLQRNEEDHILVDIFYFQKKITNLQLIQKKYKKNFLRNLYFKELYKKV